MKRYIAFVGSTYYPEGGWDDFAGDFDDPDEAAADVQSNDWNWGHVIDLTTGKCVRQGHKRWDNDEWAWETLP